MAAIPLSEAIERLAQAVEKASPDDILAIYAELYPASGQPDVNDLDNLAPKMALHIRTGIEPEEAVDLWNTLFHSVPNVFYNEEDGALHQAEQNLRYAEH